MQYCYTAGTLSKESQESWLEIFQFWDSQEKWWDLLSYWIPGDQFTNWVKWISYANHWGPITAYLWCCVCLKPGYEHRVHGISLNESMRNILVVMMSFGLFKCLILPQWISTVLDIYQGWMSSLFMNMHPNDPKNECQAEHAKTCLDNILYMKCNTSKSIWQYWTNADETQTGRNASEQRSVHSAQSSFNLLGIFLFKSTISHSLTAMKLFSKWVCQRMWVEYMLSVTQSSSPRNIHQGKNWSSNQSHDSQRRILSSTGAKNSKGPLRKQGKGARVNQVGLPDPQQITCHLCLWGSYAMESIKTQDDTVIFCLSKKFNEA